MTPGAASVEVRFWGTRGSVPAPGPHTARFGGNTPSLEVRTPGGGLVIFDAGTGIRELGRALEARAEGAPIRGDIFLSHAHWDHIQGLPFFSPLFDRRNAFTIWSMDAPAGTTERVIRAQMSPGVFPISFAEVEAAVTFRAIDDAVPVRGAGYEMRAIPVRHPGGALGYRLGTAAATRGGLVYISDNELGDEPRYRSPAGWRDALVAFARGASVLVHDATYTEEEYERHRGWGHSHDRHAVELALDCGVERLVLFHHRPERTDAEVDERVAACTALVGERGAALTVTAAAEGMTLTVPSA